MKPNERLVVGHSFKDMSERTYVKKGMQPLVGRAFRKGGSRDVIKRPNGLALRLAGYSPAGARM